MRSIGSTGCDERRCVTRRAFLGTGTSCYAHLLFVCAVPTELGKFLLSSPVGLTVAEEPWGRLERIGEGLWAMISTPLTGDRTSLCNGGIIAGSHGTLVVEGFATNEGARWMAERARELTGRWPTHVVLTHFHGDHTNGLEGYAGESTPAVMISEVTRGLVMRADAERAVATGGVRHRLLTDAELIEPVAETMVDLGGRLVRIVPHDGHTPSDVTVEIDGSAVVWCGDLVWNHMFPNYRDATPSRLARAVKALVRSRETTYVPGHGSLATAADLQRYIQLVDYVEQAARRAHERGIPAAEAAETFRVPDSLGEWTMFSARYYEMALLAWEKELSGS